MNMVISRDIPTNIPHISTNLPTGNGKGLSIGATIGIGIALLFILGAAGGWILVRRRRRTWARKRKAQADPKRSGDTSDVEITKNVAENEKNDAHDKEMRIDGAVGIGDGTRSWVELDDDKYVKRGGELDAGVKAYEMSGVIEPIEMGDSNRFTAELEGSSIVPLGTSVADKNDEVESRSLVNTKRT